MNTVPESGRHATPHSRALPGLDGSGFQPFGSSAPSIPGALPRAGMRRAFSPEKAWRAPPVHPSPQCIQSSDCLVADWKVGEGSGGQRIPQVSRNLWRSGNRIPAGRIPETRDVRRGSRHPGPTARRKHGGVLRSARPCSVTRPQTAWWGTGKDPVGDACPEYRGISGDRVTGSRQGGARKREHETCAEGFGTQGQRPDRPISARGNAPGGHQVTNPSGCENRPGTQGQRPVPYQPGATPRGEPSGDEPIGLREPARHPGPTARPISARGNAPGWAIR